MISRGPFSLVLACCTLAFLTSCGDEGGDVTQPGAAGTTTTITLDSPDPSPLGQEIQVTVTVASDAGTPSGDVTVGVVGGSETCTATLSNGSATCALNIGSSGDRTLTASYAGNADFLPSSDTELHTISPPQAGTGQIQVTTTTTGSDLDPDGYQFTVDGGASQAIPASASITVPDIAAGVHTVVLGGVAPNCTVADGLSRSATVAAGAVTTLAFAVTCSPVAPATGSIRITTNTTGTDFDSDGYRFSIDGGQAQAIGVNATQTVADVQAGPHTVRLAGLATNCNVTGGNSRDVTVAPGIPAVVDFSVTCTAIPPSLGSIRVTTTTTGSNQDGNGYRFTIDAGSARPIDANGSETVNDIRAGSHTVRLSDVAGNCDVSGGASRTVSVTAGQTVEAAFSISCSAVTPSATRSTVVASPKFIAAGQTSTIVVTVRSSTGSVVPGVRVTLSSTGTGNTISPAGGATTNLNGVATFTFSSTDAGDKTITATAGGVTLTDTEVISVASRGSTIAITSDAPDPSASGASITVRFTVTGEGGGTPTGTVTIFSLQEANVGCTVDVDAGECTFQLNTVGEHTLSATYSGDDQFEESSTRETHTVE